MVRSAKPSRKKRTPQPSAASVIHSAPSAVVECPDNYDLQVPDGHQEFGGFESYELPQADRDAVGDEALAPGETLQEAVHEIGTEEWIDAETGQPAEGESPPHLQEE